MKLKIHITFSRDKLGQALVDRTRGTVGGTSDA